jgi:mono/diheme cytochrome c family protein
MPNIFRIALAAALALLVASVIAARSQEVKIKEVPITPMSDVSGGATYKAYCAVCHGVGGKGNGPALKALTTPPADLTTITARNKGKFPAMAVKMSITGDSVVTAHGTREMPIWGPVLRSADGNAKTELRLKNLIDYLKRLQVSPRP